MNRYRGRDGKERLWYADHEIEAIALGSLDAAGLTADERHPAADIEALIEAHLGAHLDLYADLPPSVLGVTEFTPGARPLIRIRRELTDAACDRDAPLLPDVGRWRATLAHEAGHVLLHPMLFEHDPAQASLFDATDPSAGQVQCLERNIGPERGGYDWREVQANRCMAALLMPEALFRRLAARFAGKRDLELPMSDDDESVVLLVEPLARTFAVSRQAARIRLASLGLILPAKNQLALK